jgi:3-oxoacyl-[acyl-carrier-protein] synthase II
MVSGLGIVSPIGMGRADFWSALCAGRSGVGEVTRFATDWLPNHRAAEIKLADFGNRLHPQEAEQMGPATRYALVACREALDHAGLLDDQGRCLVLGMDFFLGTTRGELYSAERLIREGLSRRSPAPRGQVIRSLVSDNPTYGLIRRLGSALGLSGATGLSTNACAAGAYAISLARERIARGESRMALCGAVDILAEADYAGFCSLRSLAPDHCRPFDRDRRGLILGEAAAFMVLESEDSCYERKAAALAECAASGWSCDAHHLSAPHPDGRGMRLAVERALARANVQASQVDAMVAHGTGTPSNDRVESLAYREVFSDRIPPLTAPKSMLGHSIGAASSAEAVIGILMLQHQILPPTMHFQTPDPDCPVDCNPGHARALALTHCLTNSAGFGGNNASLVWRRV